MKGLSDKKRLLIVTKYCKGSGMSMRKIAAEEAVSLKAVYNTIKRFGMNHTLKDLPGRGRKRGPLRPNLDKKICEQFPGKRHFHSGLCEKMPYYYRHGPACQGAELVGNI